MTLSMNDTQRVTLCIYTEYPYDECSYAECHYTDCRGVIFKITLRPISRKLF